MTEGLVLCLMVRTNTWKFNLEGLLGDLYLEVTWEVI